MLIQTLCFVELTFLKILKIVKTWLRLLLLANAIALVPTQLVDSHLFE